MPLADPTHSVGPADEAAVGDAPGLPLVSIILPIRNEANHIDACIGRLLDQDYPDLLTHELRVVLA